MAPGTKPAGPASDRRRRLSRGCFDGRAAQSAEPLLLQQQLPHVAPVPRLQERGEDLAGGRGQALAPVAEVQLGHPPLEHLRVFGILVDDAVAALGPQAQVPPLHQAAHRDLRLVPLPQQLCPDHAHVLAPQLPGLDLSAPLLPLPEEGQRLAVAEGHGAGVAVEEGVIAVDAAGHGPLLPDGRQSSICPRQLTMYSGALRQAQNSRISAPVTPLRSQFLGQIASKSE